MPDVDDLLDELNGLLDEPVGKSAARGGAAAARALAPTVAPNAYPPPPPHAGGGRPPPPSASNRANPLEDLDALLADCEGADAPAARKSAPVTRAPLPTSVSASPAASLAGEHATGFRCSKCDMRVLRFADYRWAPDADYMFFRNFMPNVDKMRTKLQPDDGQCAFACQCTWVTEELGMPHGVSHWFVARG